MIVEIVEIDNSNYYLFTGFRRNFDAVNDDVSSTQGLSYDFDSIMHYDAYAFSANDYPTIEPVDSSVALNRLGQRLGLSDRDKEHIKMLYPTSKLWLVTELTCKLI